MQYKTIQRKERINKWLSVMLIYALFFQELIPFVHSMNEIEFGETLKVNESAVNASLFENKILNSKNLKEKNRGIENFDELEEQEISLAVSGGPGQTESSGFSLGTTDGLVDKFTGDFTYSIPLMSVEGYPIVINYNSNVGMNTEASWVGLGWDLNVGSISREMRGLPDEFNGDQKIVRKINQLESTNDGGKFGGYVAWSKPSALFDYNNFPTVQLTALFGGYQNTYTGFGKTFDFGLQSSISIGEDIQFAPSFGTGFSIDSKNGLGKNSNYGLSLSGKKKTESGASMGMGGSLTYGKNYNSRAGIINKSLGFGANGNYSGLRGNSLKPSYGTSTALMYGSVTSVPSNRYNGTGSSFRFQLDLSNEKKMKNVLFTAGIITQIYTSTNSVDFGDAAHSQSQEIDQPAYGYLHSSKRKNAKSDELALMDFNRTNDFEYSEEMKNLAFSFQTYDIFRASALGMSGTFRARRNDVGTYYDPNVKNETNGNSVDVSAGNIVLSELEPFTNKVGLAYGHQDGDAESGNWHLSGDENILNFETEDSGNSFDESTYFKALGESTVEDLSALEALGGEQVSHFPTVETISNNIGQSSVLKNEDGTSTLPLDGNNINNSNERPIVATCFLPNTAEQAASSSSVYQSHEENDFLSGNTTSINRIDENNDRDRNHISSIEIVSADGLQYTYGIPAYTLESSQVSFAVGSGAGLPEGRPVDPETNLVRYNLSDNGISNQLGRGHNYDKTTTPAYAHSFLLTEMRSSDYVDLGEPGLSVNDIGSYYKINHTQYYWKTSQGGSDPRPSNPYRWRFPISDDQGTQAFHNEGFEGSNNSKHPDYKGSLYDDLYTCAVSLVARPF